MAQYSCILPEQQHMKGVKCFPMLPTLKEKIFWGLCWTCKPGGHGAGERWRNLDGASVWPFGQGWVRTENPLPPKECHSAAEVLAPGAQSLTNSTKGQSSMSPPLSSPPPPTTPRLPLPHPLPSPSPLPPPPVQDPVDLMVMVLDIEADKRSLIMADSH